MYKLEELKPGDEFKYNENTDYIITYQGNIGEALVFIDNREMIPTMSLKKLSNLYTKIEPKKEPIKIAVHTPTLREFMYVAEKIGNPKKLQEKHYNLYYKDCCIHIKQYDNSINIGSYGTINGFKEQDYTILSFEEWFKQNNYYGLPKLIQGFEVGDYSDKPLILEVSDNMELWYTFAIEEIEEQSFPFKTQFGNRYKYARKIDLSKYTV